MVRLQLFCPCPFPRCSFALWYRDLCNAALSASNSSKLPAWPANHSCSLPQAACRSSSTYRHTLTKTCMAPLTRILFPWLSRLPSARDTLATAPKSPAVPSLLFLLALKYRYAVWASSHTASTRTLSQTCCMASPGCSPSFRYASRDNVYSTRSAPVSSPFASIRYTAISFALDTNTSRRMVIGPSFHCWLASACSMSRYRLKEANPSTGDCSTTRRAAGIWDSSLAVYPFSRIAFTISQLASRKFPAFIFLRWL